MALMSLTLATMTTDREVNDSFKCGWLDVYIIVTQENSFILNDSIECLPKKENIIIFGYGYEIF